MQEVDNILRIFEGTKIALASYDATTLKELSEQTINTAARTHDSDNIATAVIIYALSKIIERQNYRKEKGWNAFYSEINEEIKIIIDALKKGKENLVKKDLKKIRNTVKKLSGNLKKAIEEVFYLARINKASRIYAHGISQEKTAQLLGISVWELQNYVGTTGISEAPEAKTISTKARVKIAERLFK